MRILLLTREFPLPAQPTRGTFNLEMAKALAADHELRVICPVAWLERGSRGSGARHALVHGIPVEYPTYYYTPRMLRSHYGTFMWTSVRATVEHVVSTFRPDAIL